MQVLVVESRQEQRDKLVQVLSWFNAVRAVFQADTLKTLKDLLRIASFEVAIIGHLDHCNTLETIRLTRGTLPDGPVLVCLDGFSEPYAIKELMTAGASYVLDARISALKIGVILRQLLFPSDSSKPPAPKNEVPGVHIRVA
jgi:DNA-binding NarL/FixJ family response regulator